MHAAKTTAQSRLEHQGHPPKTPMSPIYKRFCVGLLAALLSGPTWAQRMVGGGLNYAPKPAVYVVVSVDPDARTVQLRRPSDGRTGKVAVDAQVFDVSTLKPGDKIRVDFVAPDGNNKQLRAASVWPEK
jgi:hypothetical protein